MDAVSGPCAHGGLSLGTAATLCASVETVSGGKLRSRLQFSVGSGHCRDVGARPGHELLVGPGRGRV